MMHARRSRRGGRLHPRSNSTSTRRPPRSRWRRERDRACRGRCRAPGPSGAFRGRWRGEPFRFRPGPRRPAVPPGARRPSSCLGRIRVVSQRVGWRPPRPSRIPSPGGPWVDPGPRPPARPAASSPCQRRRRRRTRPASSRVSYPRLSTPRASPPGPPPRPPGPRTDGESKHAARTRRMATRGAEPRGRLPQQPPEIRAPRPARARTYRLSQPSRPAHRPRGSTSADERPRLRPAAAPRCCAPFR